MAKIDVSNLGQVTEPMPEDQYWALVEASLVNSKNQNKQEAYLRTALKKLSPQEIIGFTIRTYMFSWDIHTSEMWCAGYLINGGCSDDGFEYFKRWIVSRGKNVYYNTKANPDSLADIDTELDECDFESFSYVGSYVFEEKTGEEIDEFWDYGEFLETHGGSGWNGDDFNWEEDEPETMKAICPRLFEKFWEE
jgi:Protein of unknown function (DUF4240)